MRLEVRDNGNEMEYRAYGVLQATMRTPGFTLHRMVFEQCVKKLDFVVWDREPLKGLEKGETCVSLLFKDHSSC